MVKDQLGDLTINGFGSSNGGNFNNVLINGKGTVNGTINCETFECNGTGKVNGDVKSEKAKISGNGKIVGSFAGTQMRIDGNASIQGDALIEKMKISGRGSIGGNYKGEELNINGKAIIGRNCEVESFKAEGQFHIAGLLNAEQINIYAYGECKVKEIGCRTIVVKGKKYGLANLLKAVFPVKLETELIEGDNINIEFTKATVVRGSDVVIGPECEVELVEYTNTFKQNRASKVKESHKI